MTGRAIRALRRRNGWTQAELAARLGTDAVTVSRWERGISRPRPSAQGRLRDLSGLLPDEIGSMVRLIGNADAERLLQRALLLARPAGRRTFAADPSRRLREVERARREQLALKAQARLAP